MPVCSVLTVGSVFAVSAILTGDAVLAVKTFQNRKIVQVQPYFIAGVAPLQGVFIHAELRCFSVRAVCAVLTGGTCDIGDRHKVLPLAALVTPLYVGFGSLHLYAFGVNAVNSVLAVFPVGSVFSVNPVNAIFAVGSVLTVRTV